MLASPLVGMKYKNQRAFPDRDTFIYAMTNFLANPRSRRVIFIIILCDFYHRNAIEWEIIL